MSLWLVTVWWAFYTDGVRVPPILLTASALLRSCSTGPVPLGFFVRGKVLGGVLMECLRRLLSKRCRVGQLPGWAVGRRYSRSSSSRGFCGNFTPRVPSLACSHAVASVSSFSAGSESAKSGLLTASTKKAGSWRGEASIRRGRILPVKGLAGTTSRRVQGDTIPLWRCFGHMPTPMASPTPPCYVSAFLPVRQGMCRDLCRSI